MRTLLILMMASVAYGWAPSDSFISYMKQVEGFSPTPYVCPSGQFTIGYGHALRSYESHNRITEAEATRILISDLQDSYYKVCRQTGSLPQGAIAEILVDFDFNLGSLKNFPKLTQACLNNDYATIAKEHKRYYRRGGQPVELTGRNRAFRERFLNKL